MLSGADCLGTGLCVWPLLAWQCERCQSDLVLEARVRHNHNTAVRTKAAVRTIELLRDFSECNAVVQRHNRLWLSGPSIHHTQVVNKSTAFCAKMRLHSI